MATKTVSLASEAIKGSMGTVESRWDKLNANRTTLLNRGRQCAALTIPSMLPPEGHTETLQLATPFQGLGARGVNNLASKLLLALFPPNAPYFKMAVDDFTIKKLANEEGARAKVEEALNKIERAVMTDMETSGMRVTMFIVIKYLVTLGNALVFLPDTGGAKVYRPDKYVVKRDPLGNVLEIIIKEQVAPIALPEEIRPSVPEEDKGKGGKSLDEPIALYTRIIRKKDMWEVAQELQEKIVPGSQGTYPLDKSPWLALRWSAIDGEDYGRGLVEEYLGDLRSLEALSQAIVEGSAAAAKVLFLVKPNGTTRIKSVAQSQSGDIVTGDANDVTVLQMQKYNDFKVALETISKIEQRLSQAFLLMSAIQRQAERVTAEEIRAMASELEDALGGVYSVLSQELQLPLLRRIMARLTRQGKLPELPQEIKPMLSTGLEALGRGHDLSKLNQFLTAASALAQAPPEINKSDALTRIGTALGIDTKGLVNSPEQIAQEQQQAMVMQAMQQSAPGAINQIAKGAMDNHNMKEQAQIQGEHPSG